VFRDGGRIDVRPLLFLELIAKELIAKKTPVSPLRSFARARTAPIPSRYRRP